MNQYGWFFAPFFGALIGYVTNSIAVKMLFHPHRQIKLGKFVLPFTPGIIPKRQKDLGMAMGKMIEKNLLTLGDMQERMLSPEVKSAVAESISRNILEATDHYTIKDLIVSAGDVTAYEGLKKNIISYACDRVILATADIDIAGAIIKESSQAIRNNLGGLLSMMLSDSTIFSVSTAIEDQLKSFIADRGHEILSPLLEEEIERLIGQNASEVLYSTGFSQERLKDITLKLYESAVRENLKDLLGMIGIAKIVEEKIASMNIKELEDLVLSIMKTELETIINLGALIGLVIGLISMIV